jgi:putative ABC transport system permease protein
VIGVYALIVLIGLGQGSQAYITEQVRGLGGGVILVTPGNPKTQSALGGGTTSAQTLVLADAEALLAVPGLRFASPQARVQALLSVDKRTAGASVVGTSPDVQAVPGVKVGEGRFFSDAEWRSGARVIVLGDKLREDLFKGSLAPPLDAKVTFNGQRFRVVGVLVPRGGVSIGSSDGLAFIPSRAMQAVADTGDRLALIMLMATDEASLPVITEQARQILRQRHQIRPSQSDDFKFATQAEAMATIGQITGAFTVLLAGIAATSLLVGGIGIMNIMLVSVTERTREVGVRKAVGAPTRAILIQFLLEAATLTTAGGGLGIVLGIGTIYAVAQLAGFPFVLSPLAIGGAFAFSALVGVGFGLYPAIAAAALDPVDALSYE